MSRIILAFGSFIVGVCCAYLTMRATAGQTPISMPGAEPQVQPIRFNGVGSTLGGVVQQIDSFACSRCIMNVPLLTYGGGAVNLSNCKLPAKSAIKLTGSALNTFNVLRSLGYIVPKANPTSLEIKSPDSVTLEAVEGLR